MANCVHGKQVYESVTGPRHWACDGGDLCLSLNLDQTLMGDSNIAKTYRKHVCGYFADGLPLQQIMPYEPWHEHLLYHVDADGFIYPCLVVAEMLEEEAKGRLDLEFEAAKNKARYDLEMARIDVLDEDWRREEGRKTLESCTDFTKLSTDILLP